MCHAYGKKKPFVRLCYLAGDRRGQRIEYDPAGPVPLSRGHWTGLQRGQRSGGGAARRYILSFNLPANTTDQTIENMAQYADAERFTVSPARDGVMFYSSRGWRGVPLGVIDRAATLGWKVL